MPNCFPTANGLRRGENAVFRRFAGSPHVDLLKNESILAMDLEGRLKRKAATRSVWFTRGQSAS
jgi:hypothetical protein